MKTYYNPAKICKHFLVLFYSLCAFGQDPFVTRPDNASMLHTGEIPVNLYTGVPDISIPIYTFPTHSKDISLNIGLNYHPAGLSTLDQPGNMGRGWNINAVGVITRSVVLRPDERYSAVGGIDDYDTMTDVYQFSFMGHSGRFMIKKDFTTGAFSIQMMDHSTLKIEYVFNSTDKSINSFTIYDDKGYRYVFDLYDINFARFKSRGNTMELVNYRSAHYLSKIYDNNGNIIVNYSYDALSRPYTVGSVTVGNKISHKLKEINITDIGKAAFTYTDAEANVMKDITIKNMSGQTIEKTVFTYMYGTSGELTKVSRFNSSLSESQDHNIYYNTRGLPQKDLQNVYEFPLQGWLEKIILPTGGTILYEFEWNTARLTGYFGSQEQQNQYYLENNPDNTAVREPYGNGGGDYDTSISRSMAFAITGTDPKKLEFSFWHNPYSYPPELDPTAGPLPVTYKILSGSTVVHDFGSNPETGTATLAPGNYTISIITVSNLNTTGNISIMHDVPSGILKKWLYTSGFRIKRIATFEFDANANYLYNPGSYQYVPASETFYDYSIFDDSYKSSGYQYDGLMLSWEDPAKAVSQLTGYANVKVTKGSGNGYTKYTFAVPDEHPVAYSNEHYESFRKGMLKKVEVVSADEVVLSTTENTYELTATGDSFPAFPTVEWANYVASKLSWPKLASTTVSEKRGDAIVTLTQDFTYNAANKQVATKTQTTSIGGETLSTEYYYHAGNSPLSTNRISLLERSDTFMNGSLVSSEKAAYSNAWAGNVSWLPSSASASKDGTAYHTKTKFNLYDEFGNLLESEQESGLKTSYVWGYNKTLPVAKIDNMAYAAIPSGLIADIQSATDSGTETAVLAKLALLRSDAALAGAMLTAYTHKPLIGISTVTDAKGDMLRNEYDGFGRLIQTKDAGGNVLSETQYNYRP